MNKLQKFNLNTHDIWKLLALILMFIDHAGMYIFDNNLDFRLIGRLSFPIFAVIYGYHFKDKINTKLLLSINFLRHNSIAESETSKPRYCLKLNKAS